MLAVIAVLLTVPPASAHPPTSSDRRGPTVAGPPGYGYVVHWSERQVAADMRRARRGGASSVRVDLHWRHVEPVRGQFRWATYDAIVAAAAAKGLRALIIVHTSPAWASGVAGGEGWYPPRAAARYGEFVGRVAQRYRAGGRFWRARPRLSFVPLAGIELWNEPNLRRFWRSGPDPAKYAAMVRSAYAAVQRTAPAVPVVVGAFAPLGGHRDANCDGVRDGGVNREGIDPLTYLARMYRHGAAGHFDVLSHHPYNYWAKRTAEEVLAFHRCSGWSQMAQTRPSLRSIMRSNGDAAKPLWVTEFGAPTCRPGGTYMCMSERELGRLAAQSLRRWRAWPWAHSFYWYQIRDAAAGNGGGHEGHFGVLRRGGLAKPAYTALRTAYRR